MYFNCPIYCMLPGKAEGLLAAGLIIDAQIKIQNRLDVFCQQGTDE